MTRTMVANISGARLREAERQLAVLKGEAAVAAFMEAHANEVKVLQQLVEWRRAGRNPPPLPRVQRAMLWSDGTIELRTEQAGAAGARGGAPRGSGGPGWPGGPGPGQGAGAGAGTRPSRGLGAGRVGPAGRPPALAGGPAGGLGSFVADSSGRPLDRPRPERRRPGRPGLDARDDREAGMRGLPRAGEGWALMREGEAPPQPGPPEPEPAAPPEPEPAEQEKGPAAQPAGPTGH